MGDNQSGYTLMELLIVVVIIGILATIAVGVFDKQQTMAQNGAATASLTSAYQSALQEYTVNEQWPASTTQLTTMLAGDEQGYTFKPYVANTSESTGPNDITVTVEDKDMATFCNQSHTGLTYCLRVDARAGLPVQVASSTSGLPGPLSFFDPPAAQADTIATDSRKVARSTGNSESDARAVLPTRNHPATIDADAVPHWTECIGC